MVASGETIGNDRAWPNLGDRDEQEGRHLAVPATTQRRGFEVYIQDE
jgi:hypothetical protein